MKRADSRPRRILVTDDDKQIRQFLKTLLAVAGFEPVETANGMAALQVLRDAPPDAVLLDIEMPEMNGMTVLKEALKLNSCPPIIMLTGKGSIDSAVEAMRAGAFDYLTRPCSRESLMEALRRALQARLDPLPAAGEPSLADWMGPSDHIQQLSAAVKLVAPTGFTVIIRGETGAGKELVAKAIFQLSRASRPGPFVPLDCGSIPPTLIESELFGHEKGAFTGADRTRPGKFEEASRGTLFLDEVQNLPMHVQTKLLRALQERQICRVGNANPIDLDVRILAAANEDLLALVKAGRFRRDLYHRLNEFSIFIPPLRERPTDLIYLANRFLSQTCLELKKKGCAISEAAQVPLLAHHWPGNVRELRNVIRRAVLLANPVIEPEHLLIEGIEAPIGSPSSKPLLGQRPLKELVQQSIVQREKEILVQVLQQTGGNQAKAARILQVDYKTVRTKTKQYGIRFDKKGVCANGQE